MSKPLMCVRATYQVEDKFEIPEWIDLDNEEQVSRYEVDNHVLTITMVDGKEIKIKPLAGGCVVYNPEPNEIIYEEDDEANDAREEERDEKKKRRQLIIEEDECCGKHCDETKGLKLGMGWNKYHLRVEDMITEQLFCELCFDENTTDSCKACGERLPYSQMEYREGGGFGKSLYCHHQFFCKSCIIDINRRSRVDF